MQYRTIPWTILVVAVAGVAAWVCVAAQVLPDKAVITEEIYSLGRIDKVKVKVTSRSPFLDAEGLKTEDIERDIENMLLEGGLDIVKAGDEVPTVTLVILTNKDVRFEGVVSVTHHLSVEQPVLIRRLEHDVVVPTYALVHGLFVSEHRPLFDARKPIPKIINHFLNRLAVANAYVDRQEIREMDD